MNTGVEVIRGRIRLLEAAEHLARAERYRRALLLARDAAELLRDEFGAGRVVVFGSLLRPAEFHLASDVDLAAWEVRDYFRAVSRLLDLDPDIEANLVLYGEISPSLQATIDRDGVDL